MTGEPATASRQATAPAWWRTERWLMVAVAVGLVLAYLPVWRAGFIWDDDLHLTANPSVLAPDGLKKIWSSGAANYFPLTMTAFWALHALWGLNPVPYHLATLALHVGCAVLLWRVLRQLGVRAAWLGAALWALHPVQAESVAWISELKNTLSGVFYLAAIGFFLRWVEADGAAGWRRAPNYYGLAWGCAVLAILSKSSTVMLPVVLGLCWWWQRRSWRWRDARWLLPFVAISAVAAGWTIWEQKYNSRASGAEWDQSLAQRLVIAGRVVWFYLGKLVWPHPLIFIYPRWTIEATQVLAWLPGLGAVGGLAALWRARAGAARPWFFAAGYFVASLFPVLGFFDVYFFRFSFVGDHLQYLASMGVMAAAGAGAAMVWERGGKSAAGRGVMGAAAVMVVGGIGVLTWVQSHTYANAETLYRSILVRNPACWLAHNNLGILLVESGRREEGLAQYREAVREKPDYMEAHFNLGTAAMEDGHPAEAAGHFIHALGNARKDAAAHNSLGVALQQLGRQGEALGHFETALQLDPALAQAHYNLANARFVARRFPEAVEHYETSLKLMPNQSNAENNLGLALQRVGRQAEAAKHFEAALRLKPDYSEAEFNLANARSDAGALAEAIPLYEALLKAKPDFAEAHNNFGNVLLRSGRAGEAIRHYEAALQLIPNYVEAHNNLASALYQVGRVEEAVVQLEIAVKLDPTASDAGNNLARLRALLQTEPAKK